MLESRKFVSKRLAVPGRWLFARLRDDRGMVLILVTFMLVPIVGLAGYVADTSYWWSKKSAAQGAADAAALAIAQQLPDTSNANALLSQYVSANYPGASASWVTSWPGMPSACGASSPNCVQVTVTKTEPGFFSKIFNINTVTVHAKAAAKRGGSAQPYAFFSDSTNCANPPSMTIISPSNNNQVNGAVHSNGALSVGGNNNTFGITSYGGPHNCSFTNSGNNTFAAVFRDLVAEDWPFDWRPELSTACPHFQTTAITFGNSFNNSDISGTYCTTKDITVNANNLTAHNGVTFVSRDGNVKFNGNSYLFVPAYTSTRDSTQQLLVYQGGTGTMTLDKNSYNLAGTIFAPNGTITIGGNTGGAFTGFVESQFVSIAANNWVITGTGPPLLGAGSSLVQ